jgi:hypothetical protein
MKFSQRIGQTPVRTALQVEQMDTQLKNRIWNTVIDDFLEKINNYASSYEKSQKAEVCEVIWKEFFGHMIDEIPSYQGGGTYVSGVISYLKEWYRKAKWYEVYDLVEFIVRIDKILQLDFVDKCNQALERESSGYRIIESKVVQITSEQEIEEIERALSIDYKWQPVTIHLQTALNFLADRNNPDFRNSIKESISAVESLCIIITGDKNATLGKALGIIETKWKLHGALKNAFSSLYGYTSDAGGIRHALLEDDIEVTGQDARFMLISCSAFVNYLISKIGDDKK